MITGNILLHRQLLISDVWKLKPETFKIFMLILLKVNYKHNQFLFNSEIIELNAGQTITSIEKLTHEAGSGITIRQTRTALKQLEKCKILTIETTNRFTIVTVINWAKYQTIQKKTPNKPPKKRQTDAKETPNKRQQRDYNNLSNSNNSVELNKKENIFKGENIFQGDHNYLNVYKKIDLKENLTDDQAKERWKLIREELRLRTQWLTDISEKLNITIEEVNKQLENFCLWIAPGLEIYDHLSDVQIYFSNWINKQIKHPNKKTKVYKNGQYMYGDNGIIKKFIQ